MIDPAQIDYTDADFASLRARLINLATTEVAGWDPNARHIGNLLLELIAWAFDVSARYQDVQAVEAFIVTARRRESVERLAALVGYTPRGRTAARYSVTVTLAAPPTNDVQIPIGHRFYSSGSAGRTMEAITSALILAGANPPVAEVQVEDTTPRADTATSTNLPDQTVTTSGRPLPETLVVTADDGAYTRVSTFAFSAATDRHYTIDVTTTERVVVTFGNGTLGAVPSGTITVSYRVGGGTAGNVAAGAINKLDSLVDVLANPVGATCTNAAGPSVVGSERETVAQIKQNAPASVRTTDRLVTAEDYEQRVLRDVTSLVRAKMITANDLPGALPENTGNLYVVPRDLDTPSQPTLDAALAALTPKTITFAVRVLAAPYKVVNVRAVVYFAKNTSPTTVKSTIVSNLAAYFQPLLDNGTINEEVGFGVDYDPEAPGLPLNELLAIVQQTTGVARVGARDDEFLLNGERADVTLAAFEWPVLGDVVVINAATGQQVA